MTELNATEDISMIGVDRRRHVDDDVENGLHELHRIPTVFLNRAAYQLLPARFAARLIPVRRN